MHQPNIPTDVSTGKGFSVLAREKYQAVLISLARSQPTSRTALSEQVWHCLDAYAKQFEVEMAAEE
jgi:hypothetical protein